MQYVWTPFPFKVGNVLIRSKYRLDEFPATLDMTSDRLNEQTNKQKKNPGGHWKTL